MSYVQPQPTPEQIEYWKRENIFKAYEHFSRAQIIAQTLTVGEANKHVYNFKHFDSVFGHIRTHIQKLIQLIAPDVDVAQLPDFTVPAKDVTLDIFEHNLLLGFACIKKLPRAHGFLRWFGFSSWDEMTKIIFLLLTFENSLKYMIYDIVVLFPRLHEQRILEEEKEQQLLEHLEKQEREGKIHYNEPALRNIYKRREERYFDLQNAIERLEAEHNPEYAERLASVRAELVKLEVKNRKHQDNRYKLDNAYNAYNQAQKKSVGQQHKKNTHGISKKGGRNKSKRVNRNKRRSYRY